MSSRELILNKIRNSGQKIQDVETSNIDPVGFIKDEGDMYTEFITRIVENKSFLIESSIENLKSDIEGIFQKEEVKNLIYPHGLPIEVNELNIDNKFKFDKPIEEFREEIFNYDVSIIKASYAVSSHGVCCIASSKEQPRLLSLTPKVCIMLVDKKTIVKSLSEALGKLKESSGGILPTNVIFISGPSRTADIELISVLGVHGSQIAYVVTY